MRLVGNYVHLFDIPYLIDHLGLTNEEAFGNDIENFEKLSSAINMHIRKLNFKSRAELIEKNITYKNEYAIFAQDGKVTYILLNLF